MDFLGLRTLTVIQNAVRMVEKNRKISLDIEQIDYGDKDVLDSLGTGRTDGVFQLESAGMKNFMKELKPGSLEDVIAGISLYRPGPMDFIPKYIRGKNDSGNISYDCKELEPILEPTYGCIVYQEQVMQIVQNLAGYTMGQADNIRRAMSKKKQYVIDAERKNFVYGNEEQNIKGCIQNGIDERVANGIYDSMVDFAKYAFNKSHAAAYAVVSYQTAYLKYYYPIEFMAALMTSVIDNTGKVSEYIYTCRQMEIELLPPDINEGESGFSVSGNAIRYGLSAIKSVGRPVIEAIIAEREERGEFRTLNDFITRMAGREVNKRTIENFIKAGALDGFEGNRRQKMMIYGSLLDAVNQEKKHSMAGQMTLFDIAGEEEKKDFEIRLPDIEEYDREELLGFEKEVLGVYIRGHPLEEYVEKLKKNATRNTNDFVLDEETGAVKVGDNERVMLGGMITEKTIKYTKNNQTMAFLTLEDLVGTVEVIVFPRDYERYHAKLETDAKIFVLGRASVEEERNGKIICEKIYSFDETKRELWLQFETMQAYADKEAELFDRMKNYDGGDSVVIYLSDTKQMKRLPANRSVGVNGALLEEMYGFVGKNNVKLVEKSLERIAK